MPLTRRALITAAGVAVVAGCSTTSPQPSPSSPSASSPSSAVSTSPTPAPQLTDPGAARTAVNNLLAEAGDHPALKLDLTVDSAVLSVLNDGQVLGYSWEKGVITKVTSDVEYVGQTSFDPAAFAFDDLKKIFEVAGGLSGSTSNQQLHIVDYNNGEVLMTVTTRPESRPVFFRADASPIHELDFTSAAGIEEGLRDALGDRTQLSAIGYDKSGLWADSPDPTAEGVMIRRTRPALLPTFVSTRKQSAPDHLLAPVDADPQVLAKLMKDLPTKLSKPADVTISWVLDFTNGGTEPTITLNVGGQKVITDLKGLDITSRYPQ